MDFLKAKSALQDLVVRLHDAEKGYEKIYSATANPILKKWMEKYGAERKEFRKQLIFEASKIGKDPEVHTSFLGDLHRMFIDIKLNVLDNSLPQIVDEIERGSTVLIEDYDKTLELNLNSGLRVLLQAQKQKISEQLTSLTNLRDELLAAS